MYGEGDFDTLAADGTFLVGTEDEYANVAAAAAAIAANATIAATDGFFAYFDSTLGYAQLVYTTDLGANGTEAVIAKFTDIDVIDDLASFSTSDFIFIA